MNLLRYGCIGRIINLQHADVGAELVRLKSAHSRFNPELSRFVTGGGHNPFHLAILLSPSAHNQGQAVQVLAQLLHLCVETGEVKMEVKPLDRKSTRLNS